MTVRAVRPEINTAACGDRQRAGGPDGATGAARRTLTVFGTWDSFVERCVNEAFSVFRHQWYSA